MGGIFTPISTIIATVLNTLSTLLTKFFQDATQETLKEAIALLMQAPWPDLSASWYKGLWDSAFGFTVLVSFMVLVFHAMMTMIFSRYSSLGAAAVGFAKNLLTGTFMLVVVYGAMLCVTLVLTMVGAIVQALTGTPDWASLLTANHNYSVADALVQYLVLMVSGTNAALLYIQVTLMNGEIVLFLIWYLFAGALGFGLFGRIIRTILLAAIGTMIVSRVAQAIILGGGAVVVHFGDRLGFAPIAFALVSALCSLLALFTPTVMFVVLCFAFYRHERQVDPAVIAQRFANQRTRAYSTDQLNTRRAAAVTKVHDGAKEFGHEVIRVAAVTAAVAGISKLTASILAKIPTPQTKLAALGVAAVGVASKAAQNKASQTIHDRVARPGRSNTP